MRVWILTTYKIWLDNRKKQYKGIEKITINASERSEHKVVGRTFWPRLHSTIFYWKQETMQFHKYIPYNGFIITDVFTGE